MQLCEKWTSVAYSDMPIGTKVFNGFPSADSNIFRFSVTQLRWTWLPLVASMLNLWSHIVSNWRKRFRLSKLLVLEPVVQSK